MAAPFLDSRWPHLMNVLLPHPMTVSRLLFVTSCGIFATITLNRVHAAAGAAAPDLDRAALQFAQICATCHGSDANGTDRGPSLIQGRGRRIHSEADILAIIQKGSGTMPAIPLPEDQQLGLARYVKSLHLSAFEAAPQGDIAAGERFFFGAGQCATCHTAAGRGGSPGPDLTHHALEVTLAELTESLRNPSRRLADGYTTAAVQLKDGTVLRGFLRNRGSHDLQLQLADGSFRLLTDDEYTRVTESPDSTMPALEATPEQQRDLIAYLSRLSGVSPGPAPEQQEGMDSTAIAQILQPQTGDWPTYNGNVNGNRYSSLTQINRANVGALELQWIYPIDYDALETTPLVVDGLMYVTGPNQVHALDARTGRRIWSYSRPRTPGGTISVDAAKGANRGVGLLGDRVFFATDNAHLLCLNRFTGGLMWEVDTRPSTMHYGATGAPLVARDLVITGVGGGDEGIRGFIAAYHATTGELAWRFWTVPGPGDSGYETWQGTAVAQGGGSTWLTGTYDPETNLLYWPTGNPFPDTDGDERQGDNLYTNCILALDLDTEELKWHFQYTPHDLHDWDANQPPVLVDAEFGGRERKLLLHANRNGFYYVLDRVSGEFLQATQFVEKLNWASGIGPDGRPLLLPANETNVAGVKCCPAVRGATNWYSTAYNPATDLYYVMAVEDCSVYRKAQYGGFVSLSDPDDPGKRYLRALNMQTGTVAWEILQFGPPEINYAGVLSTAGGLVFYGESSGGFAAVDASSGETLWHFETNQMWKASPMTYAVKSRQYVAIASGANILSFALPAETLQRRE